MNSAQRQTSLVAECHKETMSYWCFRGSGQVNILDVCRRMWIL